ncbi:chondroitin sulfate proteoglycan 5b isoform X1 [Pseudochaenichthys georgianus]|uniref:chondroitin sulfate proteoglycan 5b isoform X1 n=1 Tax=Pseudochaenichthys georgianus TaxID=52239 RepID=UPI00146D5834|nr:chondroitin sulfate proteoglycan 5b isoform X1 [Pseudochaenichthys georgianus]
MARSDSRLDTWQVLLTISMVIIPLSAHGRHSLSRHHHHHNQSSVNKEALNARMVLSDDSAERDHLIGLGAKLPLSSTKHHHSHKHAHLDVVDEDPPVGEELTAGGAGPDQPGNPMSDEVITVEFHSPAPEVVPADGALDWAKAPQPQKQKGGDPTAWTLSDFYDYLSPDNDPSALDATPEPEPTPSPPPDMEDENPLLAGSPAVPDNVRPDVEPSIPAPSMPAPDTGDGLGLGGAMGADGCRLGYVRSGPGVCVSQCDIDPNFCLNGGVCTVVAGMGAFCRCNVQEYIWNKGTRCDWAITEFQVMCVLVGVASVVLIFLFMIIVCFAKKLHRLKNENNRLRKRRCVTGSKYRPQSSEPQTDGLSVSTMADGSQPNDDPQKQEDPAKSAQAKEEGSMNILNSHSPKHENNRPTSVAHDPGHTPNNTEENAEDGVTIGLEVLLPKEAKLHSETGSPLQYDVFLYKVPNSEDSTSPIHAPPTQSGNSYSSSHPMPKSPKSPKTPKVHKSPKHSREHSHSSREALSGRHASPGRHPSPGHHPSPSRHSAPSSCHPPSHHSPSRYTSFPPSSSSSSSTPPELRRPRGRSQALGSECSWTGREQGGHLHPSPSSPHLTQPSPSPSRVKCSPVSTRSLPVLS